MEKQGNKIKRLFDGASRSAAAKLSGWINPLSTPEKKRGFLVLGICTAVACGLLIVRSVQTGHGSAALHVDTITSPAYIHPENASGQESEQSMIAQYNRMIRFKQLADRLRSSSDTRLLDSLMKAHPGLRDSLKIFIETYYSH